MQQKTHQTRKVNKLVWGWFLKALIQKLNACSTAECNRTSIYLNNECRTSRLQQHLGGSPCSRPVSVTSPKQVWICLLKQSMCSWSDSNLAEIGEWDWRVEGVMIHCCHESIWCTRPASRFNLILRVFLNWILMKKNLYWNDSFLNPK